MDVTHTQYTLNVGLMAGGGADANLKATMALLESSKLKLLVPLEPQGNVSLEQKKEEVRK